MHGCPEFSQGHGCPEFSTADQYEQAIEISHKYNISTGGKVHFVGHSLGGGLATAAAVHIGRSATVFNAASLHGGVISGLISSPGSIVHFQSGIDVLRLGNALTPTRQTGTQISLGLAGGHSMRGVCRAMGC